MTLKQLAANTNRNPFRVFFLLGWVLSILGALPWLSFAWIEHSTYPGGFHAIIMSRGFIACFVFGFLMTAIPKFTETEPAKTWEVAIGMASALASAALAHYGQGIASSLLTFAQILIITAFIVRRFVKKKNNPPGTFLFLAAGLFLGAAGSVIGILGNLDLAMMSSKWQIFGRLVGFYGMILAMILGVGSRLFPGILGWSDIVEAQRRNYERPVSFSSVVPMDVRVGIVLFLGSFVIEAFFEEQAGRMIRAALVTYVAMRYWRIYRRPPKSTWLTAALMTSAWTVVLGEWLAAAVPSVGLDGKHLVFIGGFSLLAFLVGSRVTLAHGEGLAQESRRWPYIPFTGLVLLAAATRVAVHWTPNSYVPHLAYAALVWVLAVILWGMAFVPRLLAGMRSKT